MKRNIIYGFLYGVGFGLVGISIRKLDYMLFALTAYAMWLVFVIQLLTIGLSARKLWKDIEPRIEN